MELLDFIQNDLQEKGYLDLLTKINEADLILLHFNLGLYIRNTYLWHNEKNCIILSKFFKTNSLDIDKLSSCIINYFYKKFNN